MNLRERLRTMDRRLRVMLISTVLLVIPQIGQFVAIRDINFTGHQSPLAILFMLAGIFIVPTSFILTAAILYAFRRTWREHEVLYILGAINLILIASLIWFFVNQCGWAMVFGLHLRGCR